MLSNVRHAGARWNTWTLITHSVKALNWPSECVVLMSELNNLIVRMEQSVWDSCQSLDMFDLGSEDSLDEALKISGVLSVTRKNEFNLITIAQSALNQVQNLAIDPDSDSAFKIRANLLRLESEFQLWCLAEKSKLDSTELSEVRQLFKKLKEEERRLHRSSASPELI